MDTLSLKTHKPLSQLLKSGIFSAKSHGEQPVHKVRQELCFGKAADEGAWHVIRIDIKPSD